LAGLSTTRQRPTFSLGLILPLYGRVLKSWTFLLILLLGMGATGFLAHVSRPVFRSEAVLLYQERSGANPVGSQHDAPTPRRIGLSLQETLFSHALLERLITEFGLYTKLVARYGIGAGIEEMQKKDLHFTVREGYTFRVSFDAKSPELAQAVVKRTSELLLQSHVDGQAQEAKQIQEFLDSEKSRAEEEVRGRESELTLLMAQHPEVIDVTGGRTGTLAASNSGAETASLGLEMQALQLRERVDQARRRPAAFSEGGKPVPRGDGNEARTRAEMEVAAAQRDLTDKQSLFTEEYPDVKRAALRLATAKAYLKRVEANTASATPVAPGASTTSPPSGADQAEVRFLQQQLELVEKQVRAARSQARPSPPRVERDPHALAKVHSQYIELERRARESREHLALLENRHFQVEMQSVFAAQGKQGDLVIVDPAFKPVVPLRSTRTKILLIGVLASLCLSLSMSLFVTLRDDRLCGAQDLLRFGLPGLLCEVPDPEKSEELS